MNVLQSVVNIGHAASLKEISERSGLDASQTHRYVSSLVNCGMLTQIESGKYDLGYAALRTGLAALARQQVFLAAQAAAEDLTASTGASSLVSFWSKGGPVILRVYHGQPPVYTTLGIGSWLPVTTSATGRAFMSFAPEALLTQFLKAEGWRTPLAKNKELLDIREKVRATGLATVDGSVIPGLRAAAAAVFGADNMIAAVISVVASDVVARDRDKATAKRLLEVCRKCSFELGATLHEPK